MKILAIGLDATDYGKSRSLEVYFMEHMAKLGHTVHMIVERDLFYDKNDPQPDNFTFEQFPVNETRFLDSDNVNKLFTEGYKRIYEDKTEKMWYLDKIKTFMPDIIFSTSISGCNFGLYLKKRHNVPFVVQILDIPRFRLKYERYRKEWEVYLNQAENADFILVNTQPGYDIITSLFKGQLNHKMKKIYYGINTEIPDKISEQEIKYDIVTVGRIVNHKAPEKLFYVLAKLKKMGFTPKVAFIGSDNYADQKMLVQLIDLAYFMHIQNQVDFLGAVDDYKKFEVIKQSKLMYVTDICNEIGSLVGTEGSYCKIPVICSDMPINRERYGDTVYYVDPFDIEEAAEQIIRLMKPGLWPTEDFLERTKKWIKENRSYQKQAEETLEVFDILVKK